jgi:RND family efflux transporter MFP subunit
MMTQGLLQKNRTKGEIKQWMVLLIAIAILFIVLLFIYFQVSGDDGGRPMPSQAKSMQLPEVEVVTVSPAQYTAAVTSYGEALPHYALSLTAQVSGQVDKLNKKFESGLRVKKGDVLIQLERSAYEAAVAAAENNVATAQLALLEEQRAVTQAKSEWEASGIAGKPASALVLREPQLKAAVAAVKHAKAALRDARKNLSRTKILAPFDALVVERHVSPGTYLQPGTEVASLYSIERVEIKIDLSSKDWRNLQQISTQKIVGFPVQLQSVEGEKHWGGNVLRIEQHLDGTTRQRSLIVAVNQPLDQTPKLYPGTFLKAKVKGRTLDNLWKLPSSALSQRGEIWYVVKEGVLANFSASPVFSDSDAIYIEVPEALNNAAQHILFHPLSSYLQGMKVKVIQREVSHD